MAPSPGMAHSLLLFILAAPLASHIPLAALAAVLALVAWDMVEKPAFATLLRASWGDAAVLLVTLVLTLFRDLTEAIVVGFEAKRQNVALYVIGAAAPLRRELIAHGVRPPLVRVASSISTALARASRTSALSQPAAD